MSDLTATNCGCGCDNGNGMSSCLWIILLLCCCGGCGGSTFPSEEGSDPLYILSNRTTLCKSGMYPSAHPAFLII